jgi:hypothetical protein
MQSEEQKQVMAIIVASPLTQNIYERIGVDILSESFDIKVIDCLEWVRHYEQKPVYNAMQAENIYQADSEIAFMEILNSLPPSFVLDFLGRGAYTRKVQKICKGLGALYITHSLTPAPNPVSQNKLLHSLVHYPVETIKKIIPFIYRKISQQNSFPPDIALLAGSESKNSWTKTAKKIIYTASPACHELRRAESHVDLKNSLPVKEYILFIDDCLALSFDFKLGSHSSIIQSDEYFSLLNTFFTEVEEVFNMPIVIAAHPNGKEYSNYDLYFKNRATIFDATAQLALNCKFVMTHYSSAINYPVLLRKPIWLLNFEKLRIQPQGLVLNNIKKLLKCREVDIDDSTSLTKTVDFSIDEPSYKDYEEKYITNVNIDSNSSFSELIDYLKSLN